MKRQAVIVLKDEQGKILLQQRDKKAPRYPNYWGFFGGGIEKEETPEIALKREAKEELEIENLENYKFFGKYKLNDEEGTFEEYVFILPFSILGVSIEGLNKKLKEGRGEGRGAGLFSCKEINNIKKPPYEKPIFEDLCK